MCERRRSGAARSIKNSTARYPVVLAIVSRVPRHSETPSGDSGGDCWHQTRSRRPIRGIVRAAAAGLSPQQTGVTPPRLARLAFADAKSEDRQEGSAGVETCVALG